MSPVDKYFVAFNSGAGTVNVICKAKTDSTIDTSWGNAGFFQYIDGDTGQGTSACYGMYELPDKRLLIVTNQFWIEALTVPLGGKLVAAIMLTQSGQIDTSWGYKGFYCTQGINNVPVGYFTNILQDVGGNFHLFGWGAAGYPNAYQKITEQGAFIKASTTFVQTTIYAAIWGNDAHTRIMLATASDFLSGVWCNVFAVDPGTAEPDATWDGNTGVPGYALVAGIGKNALDIVRVADDKLIVLHTYDDNYYTLSKLLADGSALDTTWGTNGLAKAGWPSSLSNKGGAIGVDADFNLYTVTRKFIDGTQFPRISHIKKFDPDGALLDDLEIDSSGLGISDNYHSLWIIDGTLYFGTRDYDPAYNDVEKWSLDLVYQSSFDVEGHFMIYAIIPEIKGGGPRQIILGRKRGSKLQQAAHTTFRNVFG